MNQILNTDSYKFSHYKQYPPGTQYVHSYIEARGSKLQGVKEVVLFGVQAFIRDVLSKPVTMRDVEEADTFCTKHGVPFNREGWEYIVKKLNGYIPLEIDCVPEGTPVPIGNAMVTLTNTDPACPWVTSYFETALIRYVWYGSTVATVSREIKRVIYKNLLETSDDPDGEIGFKLHDFGYRGVSSDESAGLGGAAHLINFLGTDTVAGIVFAQDYYGADVCGYSIAASEHSTMTSWGQENEFQAYKNMVAQYAKPGAIFACVIDSYNVWNAIDLWCDVQPGEEKALIDIVKEAGARVVLRPDSGDPITTPIKVIDKLMSKPNVGFILNSKRFRVLPDHVRVIQGDGIDHADVHSILFSMKLEGLSGSNIGFGMGGGLLQKVNRDLFKFAMKCSAIELETGEERDVFKSPIDQPDKSSKKGILDTVKLSNGEWATMRAWEALKMRREGAKSMLHNVFNSACGQIHTARTTTFDEIRERAKL